MGPTPASQVRGPGPDGPVPCACIRISLGLSGNLWDVGPISPVVESRHWAQRAEPAEIDPGGCRIARHSKSKGNDEVPWWPAKREETKKQASDLYPMYVHVYLDI